MITFVHPRYTARYNMPIVKEAIDEYKKIANFHGLSLTQVGSSEYQRTFAWGFEDLNEFTFTFL